MISKLVADSGTEATIDLGTIDENSPNFSYKKKLMNRYCLKLEFALTMDEHEILTTLAEGKDVDSLISLRDDLFSRPKNTITPNIEYIRTAIHHLITLYEKRHLLYPLHNEAFYQIHVYSHLLDGILLHDPDFRVVRTECNSTVARRLKAIDELDNDSKLRRWDLIYRHLGEQYDLFIGEDKPGSASATDIKKDSKKCDNVRIDMLKAAANGTSMSELVEDLEAITAQTYGLEMTIRGTRKIGDTFVHYTKAKATIPATITSKCTALAEFMLVVISLKRATMLNFIKLQIAWESLSSYHVQFLSNGEDSPDSSPESKSCVNLDSEAVRKYKDLRLKMHLDKAKKDMKEVKVEDHVLVADNLEMLFMLALSKNIDTPTNDKDDEKND
ncbi:hypothetical protein BDC45DRAFT_509443 [Circinella umbellata]|nr:hypothetical protein BDC45DRAFT_509443 [Circinella umbellata]